MHQWFMDNKTRNVYKKNKEDQFISTLTLCPLSYLRSTSESFHSKRSFKKSIKGAKRFWKVWHIHGHTHKEHATKRTWLRHNAALFLRPLSLIPRCTQKSTVPQQSESEEWNWSSAMIICAAEGVSSTRKEHRPDENSHTLNEGKKKKHQNALKRKTVQRKRETIKRKMESAK